MLKLLAAGFLVTGLALAPVASAFAGPDPKAPAPKCDDDCNSCTEGEDCNVDNCKQEKCKPAPAPEHK